MASWMSVVCSLAVALCLTGPIRRASAASLLSYGTEHGDTLAVLETTSVTLTESFTFLGESFAAVRVSACGTVAPLQRALAHGENCVVSSRLVRRNRLCVSCTKHY